MHRAPAILVGFDRALIARLRQNLAVLGMPVASVIETVAQTDPFNGIGAAVSRTFFVQTAANAEGWADLSRLTARFPDSPIVALIEPSEQGAILKALRAGASQVVLTPPDVEDLRDALEGIDRQRGRTAPLPEAQVVAVAGTMQGCGSTTVAANLAIEIAAQFRVSCLLVDAARGTRTAATVLRTATPRQIPEYFAWDEMADPESLAASFQQVGENLTLIGGRAALATGRAKKIFGILRRHADFIVVDSCCTFDDDEFDLLTAADRVLLVGEPTLPAIRAVQLQLNGLRDKQTPGPPWVVLNRFNADVPGFGPDMLAELLGVPKLFTVAADDSVRLSAGPLRTSAAYSTALVDIRKLADKLLHSPSRQKNGWRGVLGQVDEVLSSL